jgi:hypothetical protein
MLNVLPPSKPKTFNSIFFLLLGVVTNAKICLKHADALNSKYLWIKVDFVVCFSKIEKASVATFTNG